MMLLLISGIPAFLGLVSSVYLGVELALNGMFILVAMRFLRTQAAADARKLFLFLNRLSALATFYTRRNQAMKTAEVTFQRPATKGSTAWKITLLLIPLLTAGALLWLRQVEVHRLANRTVSSYGTIPDFQLLNQDSRPFGSAQLKGKIWIADFIFTACPGPCPMISSRMSELQKPLEKTDVHLVSVSVDPEKDTPEVLRGYAERLKAQPGRWDFLTGSRAAIYSLSRDGFKLGVSDGADEAGSPVHSTRLMLVDRVGAIRGYYDATEADAVTKLLADTNHLLREEPR